MQLRASPAFLPPQLGQQRGYRVLRALRAFLKGKR
jgi:hypothetical protein